MDLTTRYVSSAGVRQAYRELGAGDRHVLFIHGWASSGRMWYATMQALAGDFHCWAIDLAGFGDSTRLQNGTYSIERWADQILEFCAGVRIQAARIVGHSMGGMIAFSVAARRPDLAQQLVAINPVVTGRPYLDWRLLVRPPIGKIMYRLGRWIWPLAVSRAVSDPFRLRSRRSPAYRRNREDWAKVSSDTAMMALRAVIGHDATECLPQLEMPALVVIGNRDKTAPNREGRLAAARLPNAQLAVLPAGHIPTDDVPEQTHQLLREFLA